MLLLKLLVQIQLKILLLIRLLNLKRMLILYYWELVHIGKESVWKGYLYQT